MEESQGEDEAGAGRVQERKCGAEQGHRGPNHRKEGLPPSLSLQVIMASAKNTFLATTVCCVWRYLSIRWSQPGSPQPISLWRSLMTRLEVSGGDCGKIVGRWWYSVFSANSECWSTPRPPTQQGRAFIWPDNSTELKR